MSNRLPKWIILILAAFILFVFDISTGSVTIPFNDIINSMTGEEVKQSWYNIIWEFRMPKAITAVLVGAGLSVCGLQMQTLFKNPLAGPFVLGISSGASMGVALVILAGTMFGSVLYQMAFGNWIMVIAASLGSSAVLLIVTLVSIRVKDSMSLLIIGLMFGSATGALVSVLQYFSNAEQVQLFLIWTFGSLGGLNWDELNVLMPIVLIGLFMNLFLLKPLNAILMGEQYAVSMGINVKQFRILLVISASLLAGSITAFCGPIAFIGLAVPHLSRFLVNTSNHKVLLPTVALMGVVVMLFCDIISQLPGSEHVLPINAITSIIGAPIVVSIILNRKSIKNTFSS